MAPSKFGALLSTFRTALGEDEKGPPTHVAESLLDATKRLWRIQKIRAAAAGSRIPNAPNASNLPTSVELSTPSTSRDRIHLAVALVVVENLPHADAWRRFAASSPGDGCTLYVHAKHPRRFEKNHPELSYRLLQNLRRPDGGSYATYAPGWNDVGVARAMLSLLECTAEDQAPPHGPATHVHFATESCLPASTLRSLAGHFRTNGLGRSYVDHYSVHSANRFEELECFAPLHRHLPADCARKSLPGWITLSRAHVRSILSCTEGLRPLDLAGAFGGCWAPEEMFFATVLALAGADLEGDVREGLTHAVWNENARGEDRAHPIVYDGMDLCDLIRMVRKKGRFFVRKVTRGTIGRHWEQAVLEFEKISEKTHEESDINTEQEVLEKTIFEKRVGKKRSNSPCLMEDRRNSKRK